MNLSFLFGAKLTILAALDGLARVKKSRLIFLVLE